MRDVQAYNFPMDFLQNYALDTQYALSEDEQDILAKVKTLFLQADEVIMHLGGKAGRLGECVVGTGLMEATLQALYVQGKAGTPISIIVDEGAIELFNEEMYQAYYWPQMRVIASSMDAADILEELAQQAHDKHVLVLDFHGGHDGMPALLVKDSDTKRSYAHLARLFRVGVRNYAQRGPVRRYANFIEELFTLPAGVIDGARAQPRLLLSKDDDARYTMLVHELGLDVQAIQIMCFFQSVVLAKCYERWDEVMLLLCEYLAQHFPARRVEFLVACGPDDDLPAGFKKVDIELWLQDFTGVDNNARVLVRATPSLRDLAILSRYATLVLANDTGPGHIAGALGTYTVTPYLPGNLYSKQVWSSTLWHRGVTLEQHVPSFRELEAAVLWGKTDIINGIPPEELYKAICASLPPELRV